MKKLNNLEDLGEALKEEKPKVEKKQTVAASAQVTRAKTINIHKGLKLFR